MLPCSTCFFFNDTAPTEIYTLSLHDALPIWISSHGVQPHRGENTSEGFSLFSVRNSSVSRARLSRTKALTIAGARSEEHTSELQSRRDLVCRLLLEKKKQNTISEIDRKHELK